MRRIVIGVVGLACGAWAQADTGLLAAIRAIKAIDNHAHPVALAANGVADDGYDALPCAPLEPTPATINASDDSPAVIAAWKALYHYPYDDAAPAHVRELLAAKARVKREQGANYPVWVLDRLGIAVELANRVALGPGIAAPRFLWVPFDDALLLPLDPARLAAQSPDRAIFMPRERAILASYEQGHPQPATLDDYLTQVVTPTMERQRRAGAVAVKFESAYLRPLNFHRPDLVRARSIYAAGGAPSAADYYLVEDVIFHQIALDAGRLGMAVHFHTGVGCGRYFSLAGASPLLLEEVLNDPTLKRTNFVLLHGGSGPYWQQVAPLLMKPNVYADFSEQSYLLPTRELARVIRYWLEWYPDKVMFGTDLSPGPPRNDWEEAGWIASDHGRTALALALTGMLRDGEITRIRALAIADAVMRGTAARLYRH